MREPLVASLPVCGDHDAQERNAAERSAAQSVAAARQPVTRSSGDLRKNTKARFRITQSDVAWSDARPYY